MRISSELLSLVEQRTNPLGEREIVLCGLGIPLIENLGITTGGGSTTGSSGTTIDNYDCYNLCNNRIVRIENFPRLVRVSSILLSNNLIESIVDIKNLQKNLPNLTSLSLSYNHISTFVEISNIGIAFPQLQFLLLDNNPVTRRQYYRLYTIHCIPTLKTLDYQKVQQKERQTAIRLMKSSAGAALELDVQLERYQTNNNNNGDITMMNDTTIAVAKTFIPGEGVMDDDDDDDEFKKPASSSTTPTITQFTNEEKEQIRTILANANSVQEVEEIEAAVRKGIFPGTRKNIK